MIVSWQVIKNLISENPTLNIKYVHGDTFYEISLYDQQNMLAKCKINHTLELEDAAEFELTYKPLGNKFISSVENSCLPPFGNKKIKVAGVVKSLFKRVVGVSHAMSIGENEFIWTQSMFPWAKFMGVEVIGGQIGDSCNFYVLDTQTGTYSTVPNATLNQFGFSVNIAPDFYKRVAEYDADIYQGLQLRFVYNSMSEKTVYFNFDINEVK